MRRVLVPAIVIACGVVSIPCAAVAQDPIHKFGRGVVNALTGWIELPKQVHIGAMEERPLPGLAWGVEKGAGLALLRSGVGCYETLTFPLPYYPKAYA